MQKSNFINNVGKLESIKRDELYDLQNQKSELVANMSNPDAINIVGHNIEEVNRQINILNDMKEVLAYTKPQGVFEEMRNEYQKDIHDAKNEGLPVTEETKTLNSFTRIKQELAPIVTKGEDDNNNEGDDDKSETMDISSDSEGVE